MRSTVVGPVGVDCLELHALLRRSQLLATGCGLTSYSEPPASAG